MQVRFVITILAMFVLLAAVALEVSRHPNASAQEASQAASASEVP